MHHSYFWMSRSRSNPEAVVKTFVIKCHYCYQVFTSVNSIENAEIYGMFLAMTRDCRK